MPVEGGGAVKCAATRWVLAPSTQVVNRRVRKNCGARERIFSYLILFEKNTLGLWGIASAAVLFQAGSAVFCARPMRARGRSGRQISEASTSSHRAFSGARVAKNNLETGFYLTCREVVRATSVANPRCERMPSDGCDGGMCDKTATGMTLAYRRSGRPTSILPC